jgi:hypothetical protein
VADHSVRPPEGLRRELISMVADRFAVSSFRGPFVDIDATPVNVVDAVLAALFDVCEVRERWGTRWTYADSERRVAWWSSRAEAEAERDWPTSASRVELLRRCDLQAPPESVGPELPARAEGDG